MEPTIIYKKNGHHRGPNGTTYDFKSVRDEDTMTKLLDDGWFLSLSDALNPPSIKKLEEEIKETEKVIEKLEAKPKPKAKAKPKVDDGVQ